MLRPSDAFSETTKFLDESFHSDGRDETVSPPLLSAAVRNTMLRRFLDMRPEDVVLDLGCGSGRFCVWSAETGAHLVGADTGTFFAREALSTVDLVVGELRKLPFADGSVTKAYTIDVLEHLSPDGLTATLNEVARVLQPGGALFVYTHVRQRSVLAPLLNLVARVSLAIERAGLADLTIEKLRKTDHLNPLMSRSHLNEVAAAAGFTVRRFRYYTPLFSSIAESILVPVAAHAMARRVARATSGTRGRSTGDASGSCRSEAADRQARDGVSRVTGHHPVGHARRRAFRSNAVGSVFRLVGQAGGAGLKPGTTDIAGRAEARHYDSARVRLKPDTTYFNENSVLGHRSISARRPWRFGACDGCCRRARRTRA